MPSFSHTSILRKATCTPGIQLVMNEVIKHYDISILCGHRNEEEQNAAFESGNSMVKYPNSKHNVYPSMAIDIAPYPIDWNDHHRFYVMAAFVLETAMRHGVRMKWGGNWIIRGVSNLMDMPHFEEY